MKVLEAPNGGVVRMWTEGLVVEEQAQQQLLNIASLPFIFHHVAAMPDVHMGVGASVGTVFASKDAIIPSAVGVDIGCGMMAYRLNIRLGDLPTSLKPIRDAIESVIPVGNGPEGNRKEDNIPSAVLVEPFKEVVGILPSLRVERVWQQCGTLGGGNHFIELCADEEGWVWVMLHSGSRGIGNQIGTAFIKLAKGECEGRGVTLPDKDLAFLPLGTPLFNQYLTCVEWAQDYAFMNRVTMMEDILRVLMGRFPHLQLTDWVSCHHNYISREEHFGEDVWVTRKGAVRADRGLRGIIPGSMGQRSYIVEGLGNPDSFHSCSHGAGRAMSRTAARKTFTLEEHQEALKGVECRKDEGVLDETPGAYKDLDKVMAAQADLVKVQHTLTGLLCVKG